MFVAGAERIEVSSTLIMKLIVQQRLGMMDSSMAVKIHSFSSVRNLSSSRFPTRLDVNMIGDGCCLTSFAPRSQSDVKIRMTDSKYKQELKAAIEVVERACQLCLSVQTSMKERGNMFSSGGKFEKKDATPVTVADFGVQALVSLELGLLFPSIPLVAEEDAGQLRKDLDDGKSNSPTRKTPALVELVTEEVAKVVSEKVQTVTSERIMDAIDGGGRRLKPDSEKNCSYWILDPIDGTRGFLRCGDALYVVGLALVVDGELVLGVMGCPSVSYVSKIEVASAKPKLQMASALDSNNGVEVQTGLLMAACTGCGCWVKPLTRRSGKSEGQPTMEALLEEMVESKVDEFRTFRKAKFCISDHEVWRSLPLAAAVASPVLLEDRVAENEANILTLCCGSLCKYFAVAFGGASLFMLHLKEGSSVKVWDHAAGVICVTEAGGQVTDIKGTPVHRMIRDGQALFKPEGGGIIASNSSLRRKVLHFFTLK